MSSDPAPRLRGLLEGVVADAGLLLEDVGVLSAGRRRLVRVTVDLPDGPGGVGSDALSEVSRAVSAALDDADILAGSYLLEVSTPGTDRPLTSPRHYRRAVGRLVRVRTSTGERVRGRLAEADTEGVAIDLGGPVRHLAFADLAEGRVEVELRGVDQEA